MAYIGLDPELARELSLAMRQAGVGAEDLGIDVVAAMTLSELESVVPDQLNFLGEDLDDVGVIVSARVDLAEGLVLDPVVLAEELGLTEAQVEQALAAFDDSDANQKKNITPFFDLRAKAEAGGEVLRGSFLDLPPLGEDPVLDEALDDLGLILPAALVAGELDTETLTTEQMLALDVLSAALGLQVGNGVFGEAPTFAVAAIGGRSLGSGLAASLAFAGIANAFELDQRLASAAGLPTIEDIIFQARVDFDLDVTFDDSLAPLDEFLPALLVGEGELPTDPADIALTVSFANQLGFAGADFDGALAFLRGRRFLQRSLIPGDFEGVDGPLLVWTENGVNNALLAGRRNGVLDDVSREQAEFLANSILADDGSGNPIELTDDQIQALAAIVIGQNGEEFVLENAQIQRQLISAINLIGRQATLDDQRRLFADAIEAFRSLAVVGAPAMTYRQLEAAVGPQVAHELSYKDLTTRSEKGYNKRPQFITLLNHWGIPGGDTLKLKKRKFSFEFDESGELTRVRNKKLSKWKRFKNTLKAIGKALKQEWKDNPWGVIWEGVKIVAGAVLTVVPGTNAVGAAILYTALTVLVADMAYQASKGNWMEALSSGLTALSGGAAAFGNVANTGSAAGKAYRLANAGKKVLAVVEHGEDFIDAIDDGDLLGAITSGAGALANGARAFPSADTVGSTADLVATGAEFVGSGANTVNAGIEVVGAIKDGDAVRILSSSFNLISSGLDTVNKGGAFANSSSAFLAGNEANQSVIDRAANGEITGDGKREIEDEYTHRVFSSDTLNSFTTYGDLAADAAKVTNIGGAVIDGDYIGAAQLGVQFVGGETTDENTRLALAAADKGLAVAKIVEDVYKGGAVPDGDQIFNALFDLGAAAGAAFVGPREVAAAPDPVETVRADGSLLLDYDGDGIDDALVSEDGVQLDLDGDGEFDVAYADTDGDGRGDTRAADPIPSPAADDPLLINAFATSEEPIIDPLRLLDIDGAEVSADVIRELNVRSDAVFQTEDGVRIVRPDGSIDYLTTHQIDTVLNRAETELANLENSSAHPRAAGRFQREQQELQDEIARLRQLRLTTPEGAQAQADALRYAASELPNHNLSAEEARQVRQRIDAELAALAQLDQVSPGGLVEGPDGLPRVLLNARPDQLGPPSLDPTYADRVAARVQRESTIASVAGSLIFEGTKLIPGPPIPGAVGHLYEASLVAAEVASTTASDGDVAGSLIQGGAGLVFGGILGGIGTPAIPALGLGLAADAGVSYVYDLATYEPAVGSYQLATGEIATMATTGPKGTPDGLPVSILNVDDGSSVQTSISFRSGDRDIVLTADEVDDLIASRTQRNYPESHERLTNLLRGTDEGQPTAFESNQATQGLRIIEDLINDSADYLPPEVVERFQLPRGR